MSERKIIEYVFIAEDCAPMFSDAVTIKLKEGYKLYGNPVMTVYENDYCNAQAMVKYED